jgi:hypothetical protein
MERLPSLVLEFLAYEVLDDAEIVSWVTQNRTFVWLADGLSPM